MIKKDGKYYVVVEFTSDFMAIGFEQMLRTQRGVIVDHMGTVLPAKQADDDFKGDGVSVSNTVTGAEAGSSIMQIGNCEGGINVSGRRVQ